MKRFLASASIVGLMASGAYAAGFDIDDGSITPGDIPGVAEDFSPENNVLQALGLGPTLGGYFGSTVSVFGSPTQIRVEVFGAEAAARNTFSITGTSGTETYVHSGSPTMQVASDLSSPLDVFDVSVGTGQLTFSFRTEYTDFSTNPPTVTDATVANGANPNTNTGLNFFASFGPGAEGDTTGNSLWLFFDDDGVEGDNHDDLAIRISTVPLPATMLPLLAALGGFGLIARRRRKTAA